MFELIIFIIIVSAILKSSKKKKASSTPNVPRKRDASETAYAFQSQQRQQAGQQTSGRQRQQPTSSRQRQQPTPIPGRTVQNPSMQNKTVPNRPAEKEEMSTTQMLEAKALADDREEMRDKQRQRMENKKHYGHLNYAEKYILGDAVPKGKKMVLCPYCNAENLIPAYSAAKDYNCYFCREDL